MRKGSLIWNLKSDLAKFKWINPTKISATTPVRCIWLSIHWLWYPRTKNIHTHHPKLAGHAKAKSDRSYRLNPPTFSTSYWHVKSWHLISCYLQGRDWEEITAIDNSRPLGPYSLFAMVRNLSTDSLSKPFLTASALKKYLILQANI